MKRHSRTQGSSLTPSRRVFNILSVALGVVAQRQRSETRFVDLIHSLRLSLPESHTSLPCQSYAAERAIIKPGTVEAALWRLAKENLNISKKPKKLESLMGWNGDSEEMLRSLQDPEATLGTSTEIGGCADVWKHRSEDDELKAAIDYHENVFLGDHISEEEDIFMRQNIFEEEDMFMGDHIPEVEDMLWDEDYAGDGEDHSGWVHHVRNEEDCHLDLISDDEDMVW